MAFVKYFFMNKSNLERLIQRYKAFTLAEVLIALVIIGIIAAMTIPALINNTNDQEFYSRFKKIYSELDGITRQIANDNGGVLPVCGYWTHSCLYNLYIPYLKTLKTCANREHGCWSESNQWSDRNNVPCAQGSDCGFAGLDYNHSIGGGYHRSLVLSSGEFLWFVKYYADNTSALIAIDLNGFTGPNRLSKDIVVVCFTQNSLAMCPLYTALYSSDMIYVPSKNFVHSAAEKYLRNLENINNP